MFLRQTFFLLFLIFSHLGTSQEGYKYLTIGGGTSLISSSDAVFLFSFEMMSPLGDSWEYGFSWLRTKNLNLQNPKIQSVFDYEDEPMTDIVGSGRLQSFTVFGSYNHNYYQWKNTSLIAHFSIHIGVSDLRTKLIETSLGFSSFQFGPVFGTSLQRHISNKWCFFLRFSFGVGWRVQLPPFYPTGLQIGVKILL